ncbi:MAG: lytic transglycosylase domain-containing protein [Acidobacteria bacterium]|nr:lytic transglycosylase domain-containing protein [Acidobacteriota bacterium]
MLGVAPSVSADIVHLSTGRTLSVREVRLVDGRAILTLRTGGQVECPADLVVRVDPDEVPWPEPEAGVIAPVAAAASTAPFNDLIGPLAEAHRVDARLVHAVVAVESAYRPDAVSPKGAMGLMQLMPATARQYAVRDPYDPRANLEAGIRHLRGLLDRYELPLALAAYNAGEGAVARHGGIPPFRETEAYVDRVLRLARSGSGLGR